MENTKTRLTVLGYFKELGNSIIKAGKTLVGNDIEEENKEIDELEDFLNEKRNRTEKEDIMLQDIKNLHKAEAQLQRSKQSLSNQVKQHQRPEASRKPYKVVEMNKETVIKNEREDRIRS